MKFGIDTFGCDHGRSGRGSYLLSLVRSLPSDCEFELFGTEVDRYTYTSDLPLKYIGVNVPDSLAAERYWHFFRANKFCRKNSYDSVLYTAGARLLPSSFSVPGVAVVNDILSAAFASGEDAFARWQIKKGLSSVNCVIASSEYVREDILRSGISPRRIEVVHNGIDHSLFFPTDVLDSGGEIIDIKPFAIKRPYIIYASRMQSAEKKHIELIKAFSIFKQKTGFPHRLVIAGSEGPFGEQVHKAAFSSTAASDIFITGYFPHENFPELYRNSEACIFPSVNEGVGLPVPEAMATGVPVACSSSGALREIAGDSALFFNSDDVEEMAFCIERIITDRALRRKLIESGIRRAADFSWEKTAQKTVEILKSTVE